MRMESGTPQKKLSVLDHEVLCQPFFVFIMRIQVEGGQVAALSSSVPPPSQK